MGVLLIKSSSNDSGIPIEHRWMREDIVCSRDWDINVLAPSGTKEGPPNFDLITAVGYSKEYLTKNYIKPWASGAEIIRRSLWCYVYASGVLQNKQTKEVKELNDL